MTNTPRFLSGLNYSDMMIVFCTVVWESSKNFQLDSSFATQCHTRTSHSCAFLAVKRVSNFLFSTHPLINLFIVISEETSVFFRLASSPTDDGNWANFWSLLFLKSLNVIRFQRIYFTSTDVCLVTFMCVTTRKPL
jgi:hypothetical protein